MLARNLMASSLALLLLGATVADARPAIGTAKARGDYRPGAYSVQRDSGYRSTYARRAPAYRSYAAPVIVGAPATAPAPAVAQAPTEARRFSYAPAAGAAVTATPCPPAVTAPEAGRRYSYAPAEASAAPVTTAPRAYSGGPSYSPRRSASPSRGLWSLPKTDPRKFNSR